MTGTSMPGLVTLGETMGLVTAGEIGSLEYARTFTYGIGGAESNVAIGVSRLGVPATWIGRLGADATGDMIERRLRSEGVTALVVRDGSFTGLMVKHRRFGSALSVDYHRAGSAGSRLRPGDIPQGCVEAAGVLHVTGVTTALSPSACDTVFGAVTRARAAGVPVSVDVNYRRKLWSPEAAGPTLRRLVARADVVFAGVEEAQLVLGADGESSAAALAEGLAALGPAQAVIKDGARGCTARIEGTDHRLAALPAEVVDPVGAGDAFVAGYLAELLAGRSASERLRTAVAAGAYAVSVPGDCEGLPRRPELAALASVQDVTR
ncbi:sugar kinase [Streptomyces cocklensis]|uniref:2-dehydro-3-deoxygluconokinase n=1 Tax=Actinacidiphila cocklensis TaxID=887465 RepID=A0A9W4EB27_9ACTN|nr:sugar kinase [Actinacidiphila cocklensis]MDD1059967.1 sugar kinase [Actinacidiphila cocklensis]CAG6397984.1 2-dehydro-3-deoxygluconokinase [Actinacidiphila cocklensis]